MSQCGKGDSTGKPYELNARTLFRRQCFHGLKPSTDV